MPQTTLTQPKLHAVMLTEDQIKAISTQFSIMAGMAQWKGVNCAKRELPQVDRNFKLYRGIASTVSQVIGYEGWMVEKSLHPGPEQTGS